MTHFDEIDEPTERNLLVSLFDLSSFGRYSRRHTNLEVFDLLSTYFGFVRDLIEREHGHVVKFLGDAGLIVFSEDDVNRGILALKALRESGDKWLADRNIPCRNVVKTHFGPVACGPVGSGKNRYFDVFGETVNKVMMLNTRGFAMTQQVFRKLKPETRKCFKKHTPPILYIPVEDKHPD